MDNSDASNENPSADRTLDAADAVARAAHLWIRSICLNESLREDERSALAGGLVAGLCESLAVDYRVRELVSYIYTLLEDGGGQALALSRMMLDEPLPGRLQEAFDRGQSEATGIVEMLTFARQRQQD